jgi:hypothetical protein
MSEAHISQTKEAAALKIKKENVTGVKRELVMIDSDDEDEIAVVAERRAKKHQRGPLIEGIKLVRKEGRRGIEGLDRKATGQTKARNEIRYEHFDHPRG